MPTAVILTSTPTRPQPLIRLDKVMSAVSVPNIGRCVVELSDAHNEGFRWRNSGTSSLVRRQRAPWLLETATMCTAKKDTALREAAMEPRTNGQSVITSGGPDQHHRALINLIIDVVPTDPYVDCTAQNSSV
jgi:hypothetical protein